MAEFESVYNAKVAPILKKHGLVVSSIRDHALPDSIFSRLFEMKTPSEVEEKREAINRDSTYIAALRDLGRTFGTLGTVVPGLIVRMFSVYTAPAGPGKVIPAGPGKVVPAGRGRDHWRTYDAMDGLAPGQVRSLLLDREGNLWVGAWSGGVSRYDGQTFTTFTTREGLADNRVASIFQDQYMEIYESIG